MATAIIARGLRWVKYYSLINGFISGIALLSFHLVSLSHRTVMQWAAMYLGTVLRILAVIAWFEWIGTRKSKIYGDKRMQLTPQERRAIYYRILWLIVPSECLSFALVSPLTGITSPVDPLLQRASTMLPVPTIALEFIGFIPKSLYFEIAFDLCHYVAHWTCHQIPWLYQNVHKLHHAHLHPCALSTYEQDGIDLLLTNVLPLCIAAQCSPAFSPLQLHFLFAYKSYVEVAGHSGLEVKGSSFPQLPLVSRLSIALRVHDHDLHHTHPKFNFAKRFSIWDKLFSTFRAGRPEQPA